MESTTKVKRTKAGLPASPAKAVARKRDDSGASAGVVKAVADGKALAKKAHALRLTDGQRLLLAWIYGAGGSGYDLAAKLEQRSVDALLEKILVKKGAKDKATGKARYLLTKAGEKHIPAPATSSTAPTPAAP
jgi:hypothetical protein